VLRWTIATCGRMGGNVTKARYFRGRKEKLLERNLMKSGGFGGIQMPTMVLLAG